MPQQKPSLDEILSKRQGNIVSTGRGDALVKAMKAPPSWDSSSRSAKFILTSESVDRYGDIVVQSGLDLDQFSRNPQALMFHNSRSWPIGMWSDVTKILNGRPKRTEGVLNFVPEGTDDDADRAARHVAAGSIRTVSIGFMPKDWEAITDEDGRWTGFRFTESELIECSLVPVPANPDCLAKDAGGDNKLFLSTIEDVLDNWCRTKEGLIVPREQYEAAHREATGNKTSVVVNVRVDEDGLKDHFTKAVLGALENAADSIQEFLIEQPETAAEEKAVETTEETSESSEPEVWISHKRLDAKDQGILSADDEALLRQVSELVDLDAADRMAVKLLETRKAEKKAAADDFIQPPAAGKKMVRDEDGTFRQADDPAQDNRIKVERGSDDELTGATVKFIAGKDGEPQPASADIRLRANFGGAEEHTSFIAKIRDLIFGKKAAEPEPAAIVEETPNTPPVPKEADPAAKQAAIERAKSLTARLKESGRL